MAENSAWLLQYPWKVVTAQNAVLCAAKNALHKPTSDGHDKTKDYWEQHHQSPMSLLEAVDLLRRCHRMAPFCFYNGNTFASIAVLLVKQLNLDLADTQVLRSLARHIVAGVATEEEERAFRRFSDSLEEGGRS